MVTHILGLVEDLVADFLYYDRKEDEDVHLGLIEELIITGEISVDDIVAAFRLALEEGVWNDL